MNTFNSGIPFFPWVNESFHVKRSRSRAGTVSNLLHGLIFYLFQILPNWANRGRSAHGLPPNWNAWHGMTQMTNLWFRNYCLNLLLEANSQYEYWWKGHLFTHKTNSLGLESRSHLIGEHPFLTSCGSMCGFPLPRRGAIWGPFTYRALLWVGGHMSLFWFKIKPKLKKVGKKAR